MKNPYYLRWYLLLIVILLNTNGLVRAETIHDFSVWNGFFFQYKFSDHFGFYLEDQIRLNQAVTVGNRFMLRSALQYFITQRMSVWGGYAWLPNFSPFRNENRTWQQFQYNLDDHSFQLVNRLRFEQRFIGNTEDVSYRIRYMMRGLYHLNQEMRRTSLVFWDEIFYHLNSIENGPLSGFDQNRAFLGLNFRISNEMNLEPGYLNVYDTDAVQSTDLMTHALVLYVNFNF